MMKKRVLLLLLLLSLSAPLTPPPVQAQESTGSISFQPSEMPNIGFTYNAQEYQFEFTWKNYYLNIKPFAIYNGQYYDMKQIIPFLKNQYPNVDYRTAVQKFSNYHRWGFWLEKLPQNVADNLDYLGFELDYNIPLSVIEIEEIEDNNFTFKRIHIGGKFTLDFYDLYERGFEVSINKTTILIGNVKGKTDLDLDPITYSSPTITVTGYTEGTPCTFWDIWNASDVNGWGVVHNNQVNDTQFQFDCKLQIGDDETETWFADTNKQIIFIDGALSGNGEIAINLMVNSYTQFGTVLDESEKITKDGVDFLNLEPTYWTWFLRGEGRLYLYSCTASSEKEWGIYILNTDNRRWNFLGRNMIGGYPPCRGDAFNIIYCNSQGGFSGADTSDRITIMGGSYLVRAFQDGTMTVSNVYGRGITWVGKFGGTGDTYLINSDSDSWAFRWSGGARQVYRQYTFNVMVVDNLGTAINGANVTLTRNDTTPAFSVLTGATGSIAEQTASRGFYNQTGGNTLYDYGPFELSVTSGVLSYTLPNITLADPVDWTISLAAGSAAPPWDFDLIVVNSTGSPLDEVDVELTYANETAVYSGETNTTGQIPTQSLATENYTLSLTLTGYLPYVLNNFTVTNDMVLRIPLYTLEEGVTITNSFPTLLSMLMGVAVVFTWLGWRSDTPGDNLAGAGLGFLFWGGVMWKWVIDNSGTSDVLFSMIFFAPMIICLAALWEAIFGSWDKYVDGKVNPFD